MSYFLKGYWVILVNEGVKKFLFFFKMERVFAYCLKLEGVALAFSPSWLYDKSTACFKGIYHRKYLLKCKSTTPIRRQYKRWIQVGAKRVCEQWRNWFDTMWQDNERWCRPMIWPAVNLLGVVVTVQCVRRGTHSLHVPFFLDFLRHCKCKQVAVNRDFHVVWGADSHVREGKGRAVNLQTPLKSDLTSLLSVPLIPFAFLILALSISPPPAVGLAVTKGPYSHNLHQVISSSLTLSAKI